MMNGNDDDWREGAIWEYRHRRGALIERRQNIQRQRDELDAEDDQIEEDIAKLDEAARIFGLPLPEEHEAQRVKRPQSPKLLKDVVLEGLREAYPQPKKAKELQVMAENELQSAFHWKSTGMTLYRLAQEHKVRREGHKWFFVPEDERSSEAEENPSEEALGSLKIGVDRRYPPPTTR